MFKLTNILKEVSSKKTYYHTSPINYNVGDVIKPYFDSDKYSTDDGSAPIRKTVETILNKTKPSNLPSRDKSVFIFKTLADAKRYAKDMSSRYVYIVSSPASIAWHDMNWIDYIFGKAAAWSLGTMPSYELKQLKSYAMLYWNGESTVQHTSGYFKTPIWEGMAKGSVEVIKKVK